jgi:hypothetical protein
VNPQRRDRLLLAERERVEKRLRGGLAHFFHHRVADGEVGGNHTGPHVAVMQFEYPKLEHFFPRGGVMAMLDDAGHGMSLDRAKEGRTLLDNDNALKILARRKRFELLTPGFVVCLESQSDQ